MASDVETPTQIVARALFEVYGGYNDETKALMWQRERGYLEAKARHVVRALTDGGFLTTVEALAASEARAERLRIVRDLDFDAAIALNLFQPVAAPNDAGWVRTARQITMAALCKARIRIWADQDGRAAAYLVRFSAAGPMEDQHG